MIEKVMKMPLRVVSEAETPVYKVVLEYYWFETKFEKSTTLNYSLN